MVSCSVQNFRRICGLIWMLWTNEILRDPILWRISGGFSAFLRAVHNISCMSIICLWFDIGWRSKWRFYSVGEQFSVESCAAIGLKARTNIRSLRWWRHVMKNLSASRALCERNPPVTGIFPSQRTCDALIAVGPSKLLNEQASCRWFETPWRPSDVTVMNKSCP